MSEERLAQLRSMLNKQTTINDCVGINNVFQRLLLYYGNDFAMEFQSSLGKGTICIVNIPAVKNFDGTMPILTNPSKISPWRISGVGSSA